MMSDKPTRDYYVTRAAAERCKSENRTNKHAATVHRELAKQYEARIIEIDAQDAEARAARNTTP